MILEDFIMLGRTKPTESKKYGRTVCSAGYSKEMRRFIRIYPLPQYSKLKRWSICNIPLIRSRHDSRIESWRLNNEMTSSERDVDIVGTADREIEFDYLESKATSIAELNDARMSLGIVRPDSLEPHYMDMKPTAERQINLDLGEALVDSRYRPKIQFSCNGEHDLQILDWGCEEFIRKRINTGKNDAEELWNALHLDDDTYEHLFFVGNQLHHRNSWLIISVISRKRKYQLALL